MSNAFLGSFDMSVQHGCIGVDAELVRRTMHLEPFVCADFSLEDFIMHTIVKNFSTTAGKRTQARLSEAGQYVSNVQARNAGEVHDLDRRERLDVKRRALAQPQFFIKGSWTRSKRGITTYSPVVHHLAPGTK